MTQHVRSSKASRGQRGLAMILTLLLVLVALTITVAILASTANSANNTLSVQTKNQTFNAAEAGLETAVYQIDANNSISSGSTSSQSVNGYTSHWEVVKNNVGHASSTTTEIDPVFPATITVGANQAYLAGWAQSITGGRTVYVEAIAALAPPITPTKGAIVSGQTAQVSHEQITDTSGKHSADIHAQQITSSGGGQTPDGNSYATCTVGGCNAITGLDGVAHTGASPPIFLTAAQLASIQSSALAQAQSGAPNVYVSGDWSGPGTWGATGANCTVYVNGNVTLSGSGTLTNNCVTTVVTGNWTMSGSIQYTIAPASKTHATYILGSGGATFNGTTNTAGFIYAANGPITLNGGGHGSFSGVLYSPYAVTMNGGGTSSFSYDPIQSNVPFPNPDLVLVSQWEY